MGRRARVTPATCPWLSTSEAAEQTGFTEDALCKWARTGLVPDGLLIKNNGGYLWHRDFAARPQLLRIPSARAEKCE